jgi:hypothetical protein
MLVDLALAGFLLAHGAIHLGWVTRPPATAGGPSWPFALDHSWLLDRLGVGAAAARPLGLALVAVTMASFGLAAIATLGVLAPELWTIATVVGSIASLAIIVIWFHRWLVLGMAIDLVLLWAALVADWTPAAEGLPFPV